MKNFLCYILLFLSSLNNIHSQDPKVSFIKGSADKSHLANDSSLSFPVFHFKNNAVSRKVNATLQKDFKKFYEMPDSINDIPAMLKEAASNGLVQLDYVLLQSDNRHFSFSMENEGMGAYPSFWQTHYLFDKRTGNLLTLDSLLAPEKKNAFIKLLRLKQHQNLLAYKKGLLTDLKNKELQEEDYQLSLTYLTNDCWDNYDPAHFRITAGKIEIIIDCEFPHVMQAMNPETYISFSLKYFNQYVKTKYKDLQ